MEYLPRDEETPLEAFERSFRWSSDEGNESGPSDDGRTSRTETVAFVSRSGHLTVVDQKRTLENFSRRVVL